jgi:hypothetical protein
MKREREIIATIEGKWVCGFHKPRILWNPHTLFHRIYILYPKTKDMKYLYYTYYINILSRKK